MSDDDALARLRAADPLHGDLPATLGAPPRLDRTPPRRWRESTLVVANLALLATVLLHGFDHAFVQDRGVQGVSFEVMLGGVWIMVVSAVSLALALSGNRRAPLVALLAGPWVAAAVLVGHFMPEWGEWSDPYADAGVGTISYVLALAVVAAGLALTSAAWLTSRSRSATTVRTR